MLIFRKILRTYLMDDPKVLNLRGFCEVKLFSNTTGPPYTGILPTDLCKVW